MRDNGLPRLLLPRADGGEPHRVALSVADVRRLEAELMATLPEGTLMQRAAAALDVECARLLRARTGGVAGRRVVLLVGAGDNGGDALYAGARLARRGAAVTALLVEDRHHAAGAAALREAGGALRRAGAADPVVRTAEWSGGSTSWQDPYPYAVEQDLFAETDLVVDGILGIGGRGGLRGAAAALAHDLVGGPPVVAVDLPSGVDADTGEVAGVAVRATCTVAMGVLKPGLLLGAGREHAGDVRVVGIGLPVREAAPVLHVVDDVAAGRWLPAPKSDHDKYSRGVVGISAGSSRYPGAAVLCAGSARHGNAGFVRYAGPAAAQVVARWPDVVASEGTLAEAGRVQCWVVGPGRGTDDDAVRTVLDALATDVPVVLDADALTVVAERPEVRAAVRNRDSPTVLTPHAGEFARLGGGDLVDRVGAVRALAADLGAVVLLKGSSTLVASGTADPVRVVLSGPPALATAGTGDVLAGLVGATLAHATTYAPALADSGAPGDFAREGAAAAVAAAAHLHGVAGQVAAHGGRPVAALDVLAAVPEALARVRGSAIGERADEGATGR